MGFLYIFVLSQGPDVDRSLFIWLHDKNIPTTHHLLIIRHNPSGAEIGMFHTNLFNTMTADALITSTARTPATIILTSQ